MYKSIYKCEKRCYNEIAKQKRILILKVALCFFVGGLVPFFILYIRQRIFGKNADSTSDVREFSKIHVFVWRQLESRVFRCADFGWRTFAFISLIL